MARTEGNTAAGQPQVAVVGDLAWGPVSVVSTEGQAVRAGGVDGLGRAAVSGTKAGLQGCGREVAAEQEG